MNTEILTINDLHRITINDSDKMYNTLLSAFQEYPKLLNAFPDKSRRLIALEMTIRFYGAYDFHYGVAYSLDDTISEAVMLVHSDEMNYSFLRYLRAGCYSKDFRQTGARLTKEEKQRLKNLFEDLDYLEATVDIPQPHIYVDFLGTVKEKQGKGRGRKLMNRVCRLSDSIGLPIMLFTNTTYDVKFYESLGFHVIGLVSSKEYGFVNTYMLYEPR